VAAIYRKCFIEEIRKNNFLCNIFLETNFFKGICIFLFTVDSSQTC